MPKGPGTYGSQVGRPKKMKNNKVRTSSKRTRRVGAKRRMK